MNTRDTNDRFFYESLKQRQCTNRTSTVMDKNWNVVDDCSQVKDHYITFYSEFLDKPTIAQEVI